MNTNMNMNELNLSDMEQVNGGELLAAIALGTACVSFAVAGARFIRKIYNDYTNGK